MFEVGQIFVYGTSGVCRVDDITIMECCGTKREYYVLSPIFDSRSTVFIPVDSEKLSSNVHKLLTKEQVCSIINSIPVENLEWILNDKMRAEHFRTVLERGNRDEIVKLICTLYNRRKELAKAGKKLRSSDEITMQRAEKLLYGEFAWVLGTEPSAVAEQVKKLFEK